MDELKNKVMDALNSTTEPLKGEEIAAKAGIERADVDKAIKALRKEGKVESPKRCFYSTAK